MSVTGIKKEGRAPKIYDERPDSSVKIIVLDLRSNQELNHVNENQPASKFKKMPQSIWENVQQIGRAYKPNQPTECAIETSSNTIDIYSNILPTNQHQQQPQPQPQQFLPPPQSPMSPLMFNPNMFHHHPGMIYGNALMGQQQPPMMYNNQHNNYVNAMAASQLIAAAYNNLYNNYNQQQIMSPQPQPQQLQLSPPPQQQQQQHAQIKRKPVQLQPTQYISPQIEQRLLRKKSVPIQQQHYTKQPPPQAKPKKSVRFAEKPIFHHYEPEPEPEPEEEEEEIDEDVVVEDVYAYEDNTTLEEGEEEEEDMYYEGEYYYPEDEIERRHHHHHQQQQQYHYRDGYYTQQPQHYNTNYNTTNKNTRYSNNHNSRYEDEDYGDLWKRRNFITRHKSVMGKQHSSSNKRM